MMMRFFVFLFAILLAGRVSFAAVDLEKSVVKIISSNPATSFYLNGSGFYFKYRELGLVLTSEHILAPMADTETQVQMKTQDGKTLSLQILKSDWANGLALLKVMDHLDAAALADLSDLKDLTPPANISGAMISAGFPAASDGITLDPNGSLVSAADTIELFLDAPKLITIKTAMTEFGMSGGLLVNEDLAPLGTLSHKSDDSTLTYVIPFSVAIPWIKETIDNADFYPEITRKNILSENQELIVNSGRFDISWSRYTGFSMYFLRQNDISMAKDFNNPMFPEAERLSLGWFQGCARYYPYVQLYGFRHKGLLNAQEDLIYVHSLIQFFQNLRNPDLMPVAYVYFGNGDAGEDWQVHAQVQNAAYTFMSAHYNAYEESALWPYLQALYDILKTPPPDIDNSHEPGIVRLSPRDLDFVLNDPSLQPAWQQMRRHSSNDAAALQKIFEDAEKMIGFYVL